MYGLPLSGVSEANDKYGFVNEHEIRLSTGLSLILGVYSFISIAFFGAFDLPMIFIGLIWIDFALKVFCGPQYSIFSKIISPLLQGTQMVGAVQKRFAWSLGLFLSTFAFLCILIVSGFTAQFGFGTEVYEMIKTIPLLPYMAVPITPPLIACVLCIIFMISESIFGYCVGCKIYAGLIKIGLLKKIDRQNCANGICER